MAELTKIETKIPENLTLGGVHHVTAITSSCLLYTSRCV